MQTRGNREARQSGVDVALCALEQAHGLNSADEPGLARLAHAGAVSLADIASAGPRRALRNVQTGLGDGSGDSHAAWLERARIVAILGPCACTLQSMRSALRMWAGFACVMRLQPWPPTLDGLLSWSLLFRCAGTFGNYVSMLRTVCALTRQPLGVFCAPEIARAKIAINKRRLFLPREQMFIRRSLVERLVSADGASTAFKCMVVLAYAFLLRVPSEALPCRLGQEGIFLAGVKSCLSFGGDRVTLRLRSRKNKPGGSTLYRQCWCKSSFATCPVHRLQEWCAGLKCGG